MPISFCSPAFPRASQKRYLQYFLAVTLGLALSWAPKATAQTSNPAAAASPPAEFVSRTTELDAAASQGDLDAVMKFYSPNFTSSDGLTYDSLKQTLSELWQRYPDLKYETTIDSWEPQQDNSVVAVTTTKITGTRQDQQRELGLSATITARQRLEDGKIVEQEVLQEQSRLTTGEKPPTVNLNLPEQVAPGASFDFDAVVMEPLGERLLLGAAIEEPVEANNYLNPAPVELELLSSGGLFKVGRAPDTAGDRWVSAVIVRYDGITALTQRLHVKK